MEDKIWKVDRPDLHPRFPVRDSAGRNRKAVLYLKIDAPFLEIKSCYPAQNLAISMASLEW